MTDINELKEKLNKNPNDYNVMMDYAISLSDSL